MILEAVNAFRAQDDVPNREPVNDEAEMFEAVRAPTKVVAPVTPKVVNVALVAVALLVVMAPNDPVPEPEIAPLEVRLETVVLRNLAVFPSLWVIGPFKIILPFRV